MLVGVVRACAMKRMVPITTTKKKIHLQVTRHALDHPEDVEAKRIGLAHIHWHTEHTYIVTL